MANQFLDMLTGVSSLNYGQNSYNDAYSNALHGWVGNIGQSLAISGGTESPYWYSGQLLQCHAPHTETVVPETTRAETEVEWLKRRVDEVCWKQAA